jgi:Protein of unknown function (DUF2934)
MNNRRLPDPPKPTEAAPVKRPLSAPSPAKPPLSTPLNSPARARVTPDARRSLIAQNAYHRAERRGFEPGHEDEDWLAAEVEVDALLRTAGPGSPQ